MRKPQEIDWKRVADLCKIGCTLMECADILEVSHDTLERACRRDHNKSWGELYRQWYNANLRQSLRRRMYERAMAGDSTLLIFLSKQYLDMRDSPIIQQTVEKEVQYSFVENNFLQTQPQPAQVETTQTLALPEQSFNDKSGEPSKERCAVSIIPDNQSERNNETRPDSIFAQQ